MKTDLSGYLGNRTISVAKKFFRLLYANMGYIGHGAHAHMLFEHPGEVKFGECRLSCETRKIDLIGKVFVYESYCAANLCGCRFALYY